MEKQKGNANAVTCYKITHNDVEEFEIEKSFMAPAFPIHEEYKLAEARSEFISDTNAICKEALDDLRASKMHYLQKLKQGALFLERSELVLGRLKRDHTAFADRSNLCLAEGRRQLKILNKVCHNIGEEVHDIRKELNELITNINK